MPELLRLITLINSDQLLIGSELELILPVRISAVRLIAKSLSYLITWSSQLAPLLQGLLAHCTRVESQRGPPQPGLQTQRKLPACNTDSSVSKQANQGRHPGKLGFSQTGESFATASR